MAFTAFVRMAGLLPFISVDLTRQCSNFLRACANDPCIERTWAIRRAVSALQHTTSQHQSTINWTRNARDAHAKMFEHFLGGLLGAWQSPCQRGKTSFAAIDVQAGTKQSLRRKITEGTMWEADATRWCCRHHVVSGWHPLTCWFDNMH